MNVTDDMNLKLVVMQNGSIFIRTVIGLACLSNLNLIIIQFAFPLSYRSHMGALKNPLEIHK